MTARTQRHLATPADGAEGQRPERHAQGGHSMTARTERHPAMPADSAEGEGRRA